MTTKKRLLTSIVAMMSPLLLVACEGSTGGVSNDDPRVILRNEPVALAGITGSSFLLTIAATILPPTVNGVTLAADDAFITGTTAYVSYNIPGATHMGAIDQFNILLPALPIRTASTTFATNTINGVYVNGTTLYSIGSTTATTNTGWPALLNTLTVGAGSFSAVQSSTGLLNTYAGTAVTMWHSLLYVLSGANGASTSQGLQILNPTTFATAAPTVTIADARGEAFYSNGGINSDLFVIAGGGNLYDINSSGVLASTIATGGNTIAESKSTVQVGKTMVAVSLGDAGFSIICQGDHQVLASVAAPTAAATGLPATSVVTNAVAVGSGLLFAANGEAGVYVYAIQSGFPASGHTCASQTLTKIGTISVGAGISANNLRLTGTSLLIATGLGGFESVTVTVLSPILGANNDFL